MDKTFSLKEVAEHNCKESPWFIIRGKVYDVTNLLSEHPGGEQVLLHFAGKDATPGFEGRNHSDGAKQWMKDFEIGSLGDQNKKWYQCGLYQVLGVTAVAAIAVALIAVAVHKTKAKN